MKRSKQLRSDYDACLDKLRDRIHECNLNYVRYSAYPLDEDGLPVDNLDEVACYGKVRFTYCGWLEEGHSEYVSEVLENPTWLDITKLADEAIQVTGDKHHVYFEGIELVKEPSTYELIMGS